jgi:HAD superfamily hydrolase (TIGR01450 family)
MGAPSPPQEDTSNIHEGLQVVTGIRDIVDRYDVFLLDMWGLMHDGTTAYPGVLETVKELRNAGKELIILSNSSKRKENSIKSLQRLGFDPINDFSQIITSGEVAYQLLSNSNPQDSSLAPNPWNVLADVWGKDIKNVFCFGSGEGDEEYLTSCGWKLSGMDNADLIVSRGTFTIKDGSTVVNRAKDGEEVYLKSYHDQLKKAAARKISMIVANPDKIRPDKDRSPMPGTIGTEYERMLTEAGCDDLANGVKFIGKPFRDVYEIALRGKDRSRVCMVGDALETDVTGGSAAGIDTVWVVMDGVHNAAVETDGQGDFQEGCSRVLKKFNQGSGTYAQGRQLSPTVVLPNFRW